MMQKCALCVAATLLVSGASAVSPLSSLDLARASTPLPRAHLTGNTFMKRSRVLNEALETFDDLQTKECEDYILDEVIAVWETLKVLSNDNLNTVYETAGDNRRLSGLPGGFSIPQDAGLVNVLRDSLCVESVMMYAHHLGEEDKQEFHELSSLPTMPATEQKQVNFSEEEHNSVFLHYQEVRTCDICHLDPVEIVNPDAPAWAEEFFSVLSLNDTSNEGVRGPFSAALRWYSWPLRSYRDERTQNGYTNVVMRVNGNLYMYTPWDEQCIVAPMGMEPVSPYFMQGEGSIRLPDEVYKDVDCVVWDKQDPLSGDVHIVWYAKSDNRPVKMFTTGGPGDIGQKDYVAYEPMPIDASIFAIPDYCTFPGAKAMSPEKAEEIVRTRMAF